MKNCCNNTTHKIKNKTHKCCAEPEYPDQTMSKNPIRPNSTIDKSLLKEFEGYAHSLGIKGIGYTTTPYELLLVDKFPSAIVFTTEMSEDLIKTPPGIKAQKINDKHYEKLANITFKLTDYLREKGYRAETIHPMNGVINLTILAQNSGIGFTGLNGLLITPELGPAQKISGVLTNISNLPFSQENKHAWISEYCIKCGECIKACPEDAIIEFETCCGSTVFLFEEKCIGCSQGCTYCIENCPFYTKGYKHIKSKFDKIKTL